MRKSKSSTPQSEVKRENSVGADFCEPPPIQREHERRESYHDRHQESAIEMPPVSEYDLKYCNLLQDRLKHGHDVAKLQLKFGIDKLVYEWQLANFKKQEIPKNMVD